MLAQHNDFQTSFDLYIQKGETDFVQVERELKRTLVLAMSLKQCPDIQLNEQEITLVKLCLGIQKGIIEGREMAKGVEDGRMFPKE